MTTPSVCSRCAGPLPAAGAVAGEYRGEAFCSATCSRLAANGQWPGNVLLPHRLLARSSPTIHAALKERLGRIHANDAPNRRGKP
jgi:hypothetical protein